MGPERIVDLSANTGPSDGEGRPSFWQRWKWVIVTPSVDNAGSTTRDYCALERTYLSHLRLALVLLALSVSLFFHSRLQPRRDPEGPASPEDEVTSRAGVPLGTIYAIASMIALIAGFAWYEHGSRGLKFRRGFIQDGFTIYDTAMAGIAFLIMATALLLLVDNRSSV